MSKLIDLNAYPVQETLKILLQDKTTKQNIIWATGAYDTLGAGFQDTDQITAEKILGLYSVVLQPRIEKALDEQQERTRKKAEVFTPVWLCNQMNNYLDEEWFGRKDVFNVECSGGQWDVIDAKIALPEGKEWTEYILSRRLEITCGEGPYLVSRYDASTGEFILPPFRRIGILDRKLRIVDENTDNLDTWLEWALKAFQSCYGFEYQGDSLLIARINMLMSFYDYYLDKWDEEPDSNTLRKIANIISWNIWQMDGLKDTVPLGRPDEEHHQITMFEWLSPETETKDIASFCKVYDWRANRSLTYKSLKERGIGNMSKKLFDMAIGNPPYNAEFNSTEGNKTYAAPVYNEFMDAVNEVADKVELIHPARFLFDAGSTPKAWNRKMLNDPHFKVLHYEENAEKLFPNTDIKGGVAITYHDSSNDFGPIQVFTKYPELNDILHRVKRYDDAGMDTIVITRTAYRLTEKMHDDHPEARYKEDQNGNNIGCLSKGHDYDMATNIFERLPQVFFAEKPDDDNDYIRIYGREGNSRVYKWIKREYVNNPKPLFAYSIILPKANNTGQFGEVLSQPVIMQPGIGTTETFLSVGYFETMDEGENCLKYISGKFARAMLGILKTTQDITPDKWKCVPIQDFTNGSDIDWSKPISEIDQQLYRKYGLTKEEIDFIETHVKEME